MLPRTPQPPTEARDREGGDAVRPRPGDGPHSLLQGTQSPPPTPGVVYFLMINMDQFPMLIDK
jgi:hypothetical protein